MKTFLSLALAAALCAPAFAQKMGMSNNNAPTVEQTVSADGLKVTLNYTSITWASGKTVEAAMDKQNGANARKRINDTAKNAPLGEFTCSGDVQIGTLKLAAGTYKVSFTISDSAEWEINFTGKDTQTMKLALMDNPQPHKRLLMSLYAGDDSGAGVYVAFGSKFCMLSVAAAKADAKK